VSTAPVIRAQDLLVGYGGEPVCAPVTFTLEPGSVLGLVGPNGSGKSTILRAVLGLLDPAGGTLEVFGAEVDERDVAYRTRVSSVLDDDAYFPALTVAEHLYLTARGHGVRGAQEVVDGILEEFGLAAHAASLPAALSSGQRRRLLLAAGFVRPRALLVLDEPEQRLDTAMRARLGDLLRAEADAGTAVLFATHDDRLLAATGASALYLSDDGAVLLPSADAPGVLAGFR